MENDYVGNDIHQPKTVIVNRVDFLGETVTYKRWK